VAAGMCSHVEGELLLSVYESSARSRIQRSEGLESLHAQGIYVRFGTESLVSTVRSMGWGGDVLHFEL
jgi:hypothetical protein